MRGEIIMSERRGRVRGQRNMMRRMKERKGKEKERKEEERKRRGKGKGRL